MGKISGWCGRLHARQVDVALEICVITAVLTGLVSWSVGDRWNGWFTTAHGVTGLVLVLLVPAKLRGSVRTGLRRGRASRWLSIGFGMVVLGALGLGLAHAIGLWYGVGQWSALWTHELLGFVAIPLLVWHIQSRPGRPKITDLDRRAALRLGTVATAAAAVYVVEDIGARAAGLAGGHRRHTGSHEIASFDPAGMPTVIWFDDNRPSDVDADRWELHIGGEPVPVASLWDRAVPVVAKLDCTGGWWSEQSWDAVALSELLAAPTGPTGRSVSVRSATGYSRLFPAGDLADIHLAVGYGGEPLRRGHGGPVRLVVPGRRGPEWVKWVTSIDYDDRPSWLQPPLPLT